MPHTFPAVTDHSWARPGARAIKGAGYLGVLRYIGNDTVEGGRDLTRAEMQSYLDAGLRVGFIVQAGKSTVTAGWNQGVKHADMANAKLKALGVPTNVRIISTVVDYDAPARDVRGGIAEYAKGFQSRCNYDHIPYGSDKTLNILCGELKLFHCGWQTRAWSGGRVSPYACMMQEVGYVLNKTSDHNSIYVMEDVNKLLHPVTATSTETEKEEEDDMSKPVIWWAAKGSDWVEKVAKPFLLAEQDETIDLNQEQGFVVEGRFARYIGVHAYPGHEGWDRRTEAQRMINKLNGFDPDSNDPFKKGEAHISEEADALWETITLLGPTLSS